MSDDLDLFLRVFSNVNFDLLKNELSLLKDKKKLQYFENNLKTIFCLSNALDASAFRFIIWLKIYAIKQFIKKVCFPSF